MTITRCDAINGDIDGDCSGRLAQQNLPAQHEVRIRGLSD